MLIRDSWRGHRIIGEFDALPGLSQAAEAGRRASACRRYGEAKAAFFVAFMLIGMLLFEIIDRRMQQARPA